jgi:hypothetical protein
MGRTFNLMIELFESDESHLLFDVEFVDRVLELFEVDVAVVVLVGLGHDSIDNHRQLILAEIDQRKLARLLTKMKTKE